MYSDYDIKQIQKAQEIGYWKRLKEVDPNLSNFIEKSGLKWLIGLKNHLHIELYDLPEFDEDPELEKIFKLYSFDLLIQRIRNKIKEFDGKPTRQVCHENDPPYDSSGTLESTDHIFEYIKLSNLSDAFGLYTGDTTPTFESGMGLRHRQFGEDVEEMIRDFIGEPTQIQDHEALLQIIGSEKTKLSEETMEEIQEYYCDHLFDLYCFSRLFPKHTL